MLKVNNLKIKLVISCERDAKFLLFLEFYFPRVAVALLTADANIKIEQLFLAIYWHIVYFSNTLLRTRQTFDYKIEKLLSPLCATASPHRCAICVCMSIKIQLKKMVIKHFGSHSISNCARLLDFIFTYSEWLWPYAVSSISRRYRYTRAVPPANHSQYRFISAEIIIRNKLAVFIETMRLKYTHNVKIQRRSFSVQSFAPTEY